MIVKFEKWLKREHKKWGTIYIYTKVVREYIEWYSNTQNEQFIHLRKEDIRKFMNLKKTKQCSFSTLKITISALKKFNSFLIASDCNYDAFL